MTVFGFNERPRHFLSDPRPRRGRHILAPRDPSPSDPANPGPVEVLETRACVDVGHKVGGSSPAATTTQSMETDGYARSRLAQQVRHNSGLEYVRDLQDLAAALPPPAKSTHQPPTQVNMWLRRPQHGPSP